MGHFADPSFASTDAAILSIRLIASTCQPLMSLIHPTQPSVLPPSSDIHPAQVYIILSTQH